MTGLEWVVAVACGVAIGFAKTGIAGFGTLAVVGFALVLPARESVGIVLPLLIVADVIAIAVYRRDARWPLLRRLAPWVVVGVAVGVAFLSWADDAVMRPTIAVVVLVGVVAAIPLLRERETDEDGVVEEVTPHHGLAAALGIASGFATMVANAAGPLMTLYLLFAGLPVRRFVGTAAWFFFIVNVAKTPFSAGLGLLNGEAVRIAVLLVPAIGLGAALGVAVIKRIPRRLFERVALVLAAVSVIPLLL